MAWQFLFQSNQHLMGENQATKIINANLVQPKGRAIFRKELAIRFKQYLNIKKINRWLCPLVEQGTK